VVVVNSGNPAPTVIQQAPVESYCGYQAFGCIVFWFCNPLFGLIAWILALVADNTKLSDREQARHLGKASLGMSISGIIVTVIVVAVVLGVTLGGTKPVYTSSSSSSSISNSIISTSCSYYLVSGTCYRTKRYAYGTCSSFYSYSYSSCCYSYEDYYSNYYCYTI
jgi:FtsH-binding integral membrane protein